MKSKTTTVSACDRKHKIWAAIALAILFLCGLMLGISIGGKCDAAIAETTADVSVESEPAPAPVAVAPDDEDTRPCARIEKIMKWRLGNPDDQSTHTHVNNAQIYANLAENGCPENAAVYKQMAQDELTVATAIMQDYEYYNNPREIIETYSKLEMKAKATEFLNKVQRLADPAIDFIIEMQKIINE